MPTYRVTWTIDIEALSIIDAVETARSIQLDDESESTVFSAHSIDDPTHQAVLIDLASEESMLDALETDPHVQVRH